MNDDIETEYILFDENENKNEIIGNLYIKELKISGVNNIIIYCNYNNNSIACKLGYMKFIIGSDNKIVSNNTSNIITNININLDNDNEYLQLNNQQFNIDSNILLNLLRKIKFLYNDLTYNYSKYNNLSNEEFL